jgi:hypothetical protein
MVFPEKNLWLKAAPSNRNSAFIVFYFMHHVKKHGHVPIMVRVDGGIENCPLENCSILIACQGYNSVGRSTTNQGLKCFGFFLEKLYFFLEEPV